MATAWLRIAEPRYKQAVNEVFNLKKSQIFSG